MPGAGRQCRTRRSSRGDHRPERTAPHGPPGWRRYRHGRSNSSHSPRPGATPVANRGRGSRVAAPNEVEKLMHETPHRLRPVRRLAWLAASLGFVMWAAESLRRPVTPTAAGGEGRDAGQRVGRPRKTGRTDEATAHQRGRGRQAGTPGEIPARGWRDILVRVKDRLASDNISIIA